MFAVISAALKAGMLLLYELPLEPIGAITSDNIILHPLQFIPIVALTVGSIVSL